MAPWSCTRGSCCVPNEQVGVGFRRHSPMRCLDGVEGIWPFGSSPESPLWRAGARSVQLGRTVLGATVDCLAWASVASSSCLCVAATALLVYLLELRFHRVLPASASLPQGRQRALASEAAPRATAPSALLSAASATAISESGRRNSSSSPPRLARPVGPLGAAHAERGQPYRAGGTASLFLFLIPPVGRFLFFLVRFLVGPWGGGPQYISLWESEGQRSEVRGVRSGYVKL